MIYHGEETYFKIKVSKILQMLIKPQKEQPVLILKILQSTNPIA